MALIKCPECNQYVSDTVNSCIHCGYKFKYSNETERPLATAKVVWTSEMNETFQKIHWQVSDIRKRYIICQIISTLFGIWPGVVYAISFWTTRKADIKRIYNNYLANHGGDAPLQLYSFYDDHYYHEDGNAQITINYIDCSSIVLMNNCLTFFLPSKDSGNCIPIDKIDHYSEVLEKVKYLPNFKQY